VKILVADDDPVSRAALEATLSDQEYEVVGAKDGEEAWSILASRDAPLLALVDWVMPRLDGIGLFRRLRRRRNGPYVYIVLLTGKYGKEDVVLGMAAGADDYLVKPADPAELAARLRAGRRIVELQEALLAAAECLREQATHDTLTGLWNRAWMVENLRREIARANRRSEALSIALIDVDRFKEVNDRRGHLAGDAVLRETAARIEGCVRSYDRVGRYGGDEILIILPECAAPAARHMAQRVRSRMAAEPIHAHGGSIPITVSVGVATKPIGREANAEALIAAADAALYRAKDRGRDMVAATTIPAARTASARPARRRIGARTAGRSTQSAAMNRERTRINPA